MLDRDETWDYPGTWDSTGQHVQRVIALETLSRERSTFVSLCTHRLLPMHDRWEIKGPVRYFSRMMLQALLEAD